jgi:hypothetical protein
MTTFTAPQITMLTTQITGKPMGRLATMAKTIARFEAAFTERTGGDEADNDILSAPDFATAQSRLAYILTPPVETVAEAASEPVTPKAASKNAVMLDMVRASTGATEAEICAAVGWKACRATLGRVTQKAGLTLSSVKDDATGRNRYFATGA